MAPGFREWLLAFPWYATIVLNYRFSFFLVGATFAYAALRKPISVPQAAWRPSSDLTWYVPVLSWGIQAVVHLVNTTRGLLDGSVPAIVYFWCSAASSLAAGVAIMGGSLAVEAVGRRRGVACRIGFPAPPVGILAAFLAVALSWSLVLFLSTPVRGPGG